MARPSGGLLSHVQGSNVREPALVDPLSAVVARVAAGDFADKPVEAVNATGSGQKHERTLARNHFHPVVQAERDGFGTDGTVSGSAIHPDPRDPRCGTIQNDRVGYRGRSHQESGFDGGLDILQTSETAVALYIGNIGVYGNDIIATAAEFLEQQDAEAAGFPGDPDHRDSLLGQEVLDRFQRGILSGQGASARGDSFRADDPRGFSPNRQ